MTDSRLLPLVVDLDGTLTPSDTLYESLFALLRRSPRSVLGLVMALLGGRAAFKKAVAQDLPLDAGSLPLRPEVVDYLEAQSDAGRRIVLATAAHESIAQAVAARLGLFSQVLATQGSVNLKGSSKLDAIRREVGERFVYMGDSPADFPIWRGAAAAIPVGLSAARLRELSAITPIEQRFDGEKPALQDWLRAFRWHQWLKNLLVFVPALTAMSLVTLPGLIAACVGFAAFSLAASATYIVNDLSDLASDRRHPRKRKRPFASCRIPIRDGLLAAGLGLSGALVLALAVSPAFLGMLLGYLVLTSVYTWWLKERIIIDVVLLALLYTVRILAGSVALGVPTSWWLLAFAVFVFLSLALVKRCSELVTLEGLGRDSSHGRDYRVSDLRVLWPLGVGSALAAVLVFGLFIDAPETRDRYASPQLLWLAAIPLVYWLARLWIKTSRGEMHDDPLVYAMKDRNSLVTVGSMVLVVFIAHFLEIG